MCWIEVESHTSALKTRLSNGCTTCTIRDRQDKFVSHFIRDRFSLYKSSPRQLVPFTISFTTLRAGPQQIIFTFKMASDRRPYSLRFQAQAFPSVIDPRDQALPIHHAPFPNESTSFNFNGAPRWNITRWNADITTALEPASSPLPQQLPCYSATCDEPIRMHAARESGDRVDSPDCRHAQMHASHQPTPSALPPPTYREHRGSNEYEVGPSSPNQSIAQRFPDVGPRPVVRHSRSEMEDGGIPAQTNTVGFLPNLLALYGFPASRPSLYGSSTVGSSVPVSHANSETSATFQSLETLGLRNRHDSVLSTGTDLLDPDDPRETGVDVNTRDMIKLPSHGKKRKNNVSVIENNVVCMSIVSLAHSSA